MSNVLVTVIGIKGVDLKAIPKGSSLKFEKDLSVPTDSIIKVYCGGSEIGVISNAPSRMIPGTKAGKDIFNAALTSFTGEVMECKDILSIVKTPVLVAKVDLEGEEAEPGTVTSDTEIKFQFKITGAKGKHPSKLEVINQYGLGNDVYVTLHYDESKDEVICKYNGISAGVVSSSETNEATANEDLQLFKDILSKLDDKEIIEGSVLSTKMASYVIGVNIAKENVEEAKVEAIKKTMESAKEPLVKMGYEEELLTDIENYLLGNGFEAKDISDIFATYKPYSDEAKHLIPKKPSKLFNDTNKVLLYDAYSAIAENLHVICSGEKGTGKNVFVETWAWVLQRPLYSIAINRETDKMDLLGSQVIVPERVDETDENSEYYSKVVFKKEVLLEAMENGGIINIDEINFADPGVTGLLHSVGDDRRELFVPNYGLVKADSNFLMIATMNVGYQGTNELNEALSDRFVDIRFENNDSIKSVLELNCPFAAKTQINQADTLYKQIVQTVRDGDSSLDENCVTVRGFIQALKMSKRIPLKRALTRCIADKVKDTEYRENLLQLIDTIIK